MIGGKSGKYDKRSPNGKADGGKRTSIFNFRKSKSPYGMNKSSGSSGSGSGGGDKKEKCSIM